PTVFVVSITSAWRGWLRTDVMAATAGASGIHFALCSFIERLLIKLRALCSYSPMIVWCLHRVHARRLGKPDPASAPRHAKPQTQREERHKSAEQRLLGGSTRSCHVAANGKCKKEHQEE